MSETILLTGITGHLGSALVTRLLQDPDTRVIGLVRAKDDAHLEQRRATLVSHLGPGEWADRLTLIRGDTLEPGRLGMEARDMERIDAEVTSIIHAAANVRFDMALEEARQQNVWATANVLELARRMADRGRLQRLDHVSTAYVAGRRTGRALESEGDVGQAFRNSYEASKCEAEGLVRGAMAGGFPAAIHRPSIIVGDSSSGATRSFNVMYWPLKLYVRGWWRLVPGNRDARMDIVPADYVSETLARLRKDPRSLGRAFHLAAGDDARTLGELVEHVQKLVGGPPLVFMHQGIYRWGLRPLLAPLLLTKRGRAVLLKGRYFRPYLLSNPVFDTGNVRDLLGDDWRPPSILTYLETLIEYAVAHDFGRKAGEA